MPKFTDQVEKEIIFAEKMLKWMKSNLPDTDISDLQEKLIEFKSNLSVMEKAYGAADKAGYTEKDFEKVISIPNFHDVFMAKIDNANINFLTKKVMRSLVTKGNVAMVQTLWTEAGSLKGGVISKLTTAMNSQKENIRNLIKPLDLNSKDISTKDFGIKVDQMLSELKSPSVISNK